MDERPKEESAVEDEARRDRTEAPAEAAHERDGSQEPVDLPSVGDRYVTAPAGNRSHAPGTVSRRRALQVLAAGAGAAAALPALSCGPGEEAPPTGPAGEPAVLPSPAAGTLADPDLINPVKPWGGTLTADELRTAAALCDVIVPADERSPAASTVGAHEFIDEWVSAPFEANRNDQVLVRGGLVWLNVEAAERFGRDFAALDAEQQREICDDISYLPDAAPQFRFAARFFAKMRDLTASAFYTTEEGMADIQYIGNVALDSFEGPPPEVLRQLGLESL